MLGCMPYAMLPKIVCLYRMRYEKPKKVVHKWQARLKCDFYWRYKMILSWCKLVSLMHKVSLNILRGSFPDKTEQLINLRHSKKEKNRKGVYGTMEAFTEGGSSLDMSSRSGMTRSMFRYLCLQTNPCKKLSTMNRYVLHYCLFCML